MSSKQKASAVRLPDTDEVRLPNGYQPQPFDVICKRDKASVAHIGNQAFSRCVESRVDMYMAAKTRFDKTQIIREIIDEVRERGGKFIHQKRRDVNDDGSRNLKEGDEKHVYFDVGSRKAADKVGHAMRLAVSKQESASYRRNSWPVQDKVGLEKAVVREAHHFQKVQNGFDLTAQYFMEQNLTLAGILQRGLSVDAHLNQRDYFRRQSFHAGVTCDYKNHTPTARACLDAPGSDESLASQEWDLSDMKFEKDQGGCDEWSIGSICSISSTFATFAKPLQVIDTRDNVRFDEVDDDDLSWDESIFEKTRF